MRLARTDNVSIQGGSRGVWRVSDHPFLLVKHSVRKQWAILVLPEALCPDDDYSCIVTGVWLRSHGLLDAEFSTRSQALDALDNVIRAADTPPWIERGIQW